MPVTFDPAPGGPILAADMDALIAVVNATETKANGTYEAATSPAQKDGLVFTFGGNRRVAVAQQGTTDLDPGSGVVEVLSGTTTRKLQITHYQYGGTWRQTGVNGQIVECWLGDDPTERGPNFSVRHNGSNKGAIVQARDAADIAGMQLDFSTTARPKVAVELATGLPTGTVLAVENENADGRIAFATRAAGVTADRWTITNAGDLEGLAGSQIVVQQIKSIGGDLFVKDATGTTQFRIGANAVGFYGVAPVVQPARPTDLAGVIAALAAVGLTA